MKHFVLLAALVFSFAANAAEKLKLIAEYNIATGEKYRETEIGGLSGLVFDQKKNRLLAVSDDRGQINSARYYEFEVDLDEKKFSVSPSNVVILKNKDSTPFKKMAVDFEGITFDGNDLLISSEGGLNRMPPIMPSLFRFSREGILKDSLEIPEKFLPSKHAEMKLGARDNLVFEALSTTIDGKTLFMGTEEALYQDGRTSTPRSDSIVRIIVYTDLKPTKEYGYLLDEVPSIPVGGLTVGETGLSEMAAIDQNNFYSIERSYLPLAKKAIIRIFKNQIDDKTTDISKIDSLNKIKINTITKTLLANLDDLGIKPDNIEGLCFGPKLSNGHQTLIAVSDNNFSKTQRTEFLAFEIIP